jgi:manganese/zinc/iron transport system substrate-binding protein
MKIINYLKVFIFIFLFFSCESGKKEENKSPENSKVKILATTNIIADLLEKTLPEEFEVVSLMGAGVDPHYYKASQGDLVKMQNADIIVYNGLHLEGKMTDILSKLAKRKTVLNLSKGLNENDILTSGDHTKVVDPHFWFNILLWKKAGENLLVKIGRKYPKLEKKITQKSAQYFKKLEGLDQTVRGLLERVPKEKRILYTAHDAFRYFGEAYEVEVLALQGLSTTTEYGIKDINDMVETILESDISAIFVESSVSPKAMKAVVEACTEKGKPIKIGGELFSDALGDKGTEGEDYISMIQHNIHTFIEAVK